MLVDEKLGGIKREYIEIDRKAEVGEKIVIVMSVGSSTRYSSRRINPLILPSHLAALLSTCFFPGKSRSTVKIAPFSYQSSQSAFSTITIFSPTSAFRSISMYSRLMLYNIKSEIQCENLKRIEKKYKNNKRGWKYDKN